jgi:hypothetical protein
VGEPDVVTTWCGRERNPLRSHHVPGFIAYLRDEARPSPEPLLMVLDGGGESTMDRALLAALPAEEDAR